MLIFFFVFVFRFFRKDLRGSPPSFASQAEGTALAFPASFLGLRLKTNIPCAAFLLSGIGGCSLQLLLSIPFWLVPENFLRIRKSSAFPDYSFRRGRLVSMPPTPCGMLPSPKLFPPHVYACVLLYVLLSPAPAPGR